MVAAVPLAHVDAFYGGGILSFYACRSGVDLAGRPAGPVDLTYGPQKPEVWASLVTEGLDPVDAVMAARAVLV